MPQGFLSIVLHAHLPYVRHPEHEYSLEEKWYYEAMLECYLPLLRRMENMKNEGINFRLTFSISPTLLAMMEDNLLRDRFKRYMQNLQNLAHREEERTAGDATFAPLARLYREHFDQIAEYYHQRCGERPSRILKELQNDGFVEVITTAATHGYLPLLDIQKESAYAQVAASIEYYTDIMGEPPRGIWLPECAYNYGLEEVLEELGLQYFLTDTHGLLYAAPRPKYGVFSPIVTNNGVAVFARDAETSKQVWSAKEGYPGDFYYREFYRDIGHDLSYDYIKDYLHPPGLRSDTGIKYYRISGAEAPLDHKQPYIPEIAREKAAEHAGNFMFNREKQVEYLSEVMGRPPIIIAPYDTELFGHWWFEGPLWLDYLCRKIDKDQENIKLVTPGDYLDMGYPLQVSTPSSSSWGDKGYHEVWLNGKNDWLYPHLHRGARDMIHLATEHSDTEGVMERALTQAARELLLAQSSDWPFIMTVGTMDEYAENRAHDHLVRFRRLVEQISSGNIDVQWLEKLENVDNLYPHLDFRLFQKQETTVPVEVATIEK